MTFGFTASVEAAPPYSVLRSTICIVLNKCLGLCEWQHVKCSRLAHAVVRPCRIRRQRRGAGRAARATLNHTAAIFPSKIVSRVSIDASRTGCTWLR